MPRSTSDWLSSRAAWQLDLLRIMPLPGEVPAENRLGGRRSVWRRRSRRHSAAGQPRTPTPGPGRTGSTRRFVDCSDPPPPVPRVRDRWMSACRIADHHADCRAGLGRLQPTRRGHVRLLLSIASGVAWARGAGTREIEEPGRLGVRTDRPAWARAHAAHAGLQPNRHTGDAKSLRETFDPQLGVTDHRNLGFEEFRMLRGNSEEERVLVRRPDGPRPCPLQHERVESLPGGAWQHVRSAEGLTRCRRRNRKP
jgi:hypothetical protein